MVILQELWADFEATELIETDSSVLMLSEIILLFIMI